MAHVFISYSRKQFCFAESLALSLQRRRVPRWFDVRYPVPEANWQQSLQEGLDGNVAYSPYKHLGISLKVRSRSYPTKLVRNPSPKSSHAHRFHGDESANVSMLELSTSWGLGCGREERIGALAIRQKPLETEELI